MKHRFPILAKVILLGIGVSILTAGTAITVSYINQSNRSESTYINNIDNTLDEVEFIFADVRGINDYFDDLRTVREYIEPIYKNDTERKTMDDFDTFSEFVDYYADKYPWIYNNGLIGLSQEMLAFKNAYFQLNNILASSQLSSGAKAAFFAFSDTSSDNLIILADSRFNKERSTSSDNVYHVPGSFYTVTDEDRFTDKKYSRHKGLTINDSPTRYANLIDSEKDSETNEVTMSLVASVFIEYDLKDVHKESIEILKIEIWVLAISSLTLVALYALFSYLLFVKNINKLSRASSEIKQKLIDKNMNEVLNISFKSNDEMSVLADSFTEMENAIINYVNIIHQEAIEKERTNAELTVASKIQLDSLPPYQLEDKNFSLRAYIKTAKEVGGDFYDYFYIDENRLVVLVSDVSGKGIPASLFMMKGKELIKSALLSDNSLAATVNSVNNSLARNNKELLFITSFIGVIDLKKKEIRYVNAGHEKPYIVSKSGVIKLDGESNVMLGVEEGFNFKEESHKFNKGDYLFMFTDGLNESINHTNEEFGYSRIEESLEGTSELPLDELLKKINDKLDEFTKGNEQFDDVTILVVKNRDGELKLHYEKKEYEIIPEIVDKFEETFSFLKVDTKSAVGIIIDEIVNNYISYEEREDLVIDVHFFIKNKELILQISSNGGDYDPFANNQEKYLEEFSLDLPEGGFGVSIVKDLSKSQKYEYKDGRSVIEITLDI